MLVAWPVCASPGKNVVFAASPELIFASSLWPAQLGLENGATIAPRPKTPPQVAWDLRHEIGQNVLSREIVIDIRSRFLDETRSPGHRTREGVGHEAGQGGDGGLEAEGEAV